MRVLIAEDEEQIAGAEAAFLKLKGFGIGLSTAQEIVSLFKGSISASYSEGRITFAVTLPRVSRKPSAADGRQT